jgi:S1-C subfamily serine protease
MKASFTSSLFVLFVTLSSAVAQTDVAISPPSKMELHGQSIANFDANQQVSVYGIDQYYDDFPAAQLGSFAQRPFAESPQLSRSAKDAQIYRATSPAVVLIVTKEGLGSGSLLDAAGNILTNRHVVRGYKTVAVIFKPTVEGKEPGRDEIKRGEVVKYDEIADLALVKASQVPVGRTPIQLGDISEIAVGMDVHAIGHPTGEAWTYTTGVISQYRKAYEWQSEGNATHHKADVIQTQTPINPGNSGGPLVGDSGNLVGVNSFKGGGEGLNYAIAIDELRKFIGRPGNRVGQSSAPKLADRECAPKKLSQFRSEKDDALVVSFDMFCTGGDTGELVTPDDPSQAIFLRVDRNGDGQVDLKIFDLKRSGRWDLSFWDEQFDGHWSLVGYHDDGGLKPTRFESYAAFQKRLANR